jgi:hypothetical protein
MNDHPTLDEALARLADALPKEASVAAEDRLLHAFRAQQRRPLRARLWWASAAALVTTGAILLALSFIRPGANPATLSTPNSARTIGFEILPYGQSDVPLEEGVIVRVDLAPSQLRSLGVSVSSQEGSANVRADLLVGQDGMARAVRFVR